MWFEKLKLCSELWSHELKANYLSDDEQSIDSLIRYCKKRKIKILILLKDSWYTQGKVKDFKLIPFFLIVIRLKCGIYLEIQNQTSHWIKLQIH